MFGTEIYNQGIQFENTGTEFFVTSQWCDELLTMRFKNERQFEKITKKTKQDFTISNTAKFREIYLNDDLEELEPGDKYIDLFDKTVKEFEKEKATYYKMVYEMFGEPK